MLSIFNREALPPTVVDTFDHIISQFRGVFLTEHNEDGTHRAPEVVTNHVPTGTVVDFAGTTAPAHSTASRHDRS